MLPEQTRGASMAGCSGLAITPGGIGFMVGSGAQLHTADRAIKDFI